MELVGSRLQIEGGNSLTSPAVFRRRVERHDLEFPHGVHGERQVVKGGGKIRGTANDGPVKMELKAATLAAIHRGVGCARSLQGTWCGLYCSPAGHSGNERHKQCRIALLPLRNER